MEVASPIGQCATDVGTGPWQALHSSIWEGGISADERVSLSLDLYFRQFPRYPVVLFLLLFICVLAGF